MFPMWDVKEPTHYSKRVGREVPDVVAVLLSSKMRPAWRDVSKKACGVMRPRTQKQPKVKKEPCRVLDDVDVEENTCSLKPITFEESVIFFISNDNRTEWRTISVFILAMTKSFTDFFSLSQSK